nr:hypothetical protein [Torque teno Leptonychotes weddellii virus 2]WCS65986.1 hypothetical protein [Torque teno Leptonychotes weddellii virus 2]WCS65990.1 hypothetical protein [Torque teno Leptonychotes weddellii virus 2]WCS66078.1 hypothetical protein [Torque teno Leptonychotes weddellii virus 2]WCS66094.1 hypothetical protein [Torque teno Leptonychotes weddellii virus 2]
MEDILPIYKVCFDLLYDTGLCFTGMDNSQLYYVKLVTGWWEFFMLCLQLLIQAVVLTSVILLAIERLKQCGKD